MRQTNITVAIIVIKIVTFFIFISTLLSLLQ